MLKKTFKKKDIAEYLIKKTGLSINFSKKLVDDFISIILMNIKLGGFYLKNIGTFHVVHKNKRIGRNPKTKENFTISSRNTVKFVASKKIN